MNSEVIAVVGAMAGLGAGGYVGFALGRRYRVACARRRFWTASALSVALGVGVMFVGIATGVSFVSGGGVGLLTGGLNGLRWGMGRLSDVPRTPEAKASVPACEARQDDHQRPHPAT